MTFFLNKIPFSRPQILNTLNTFLVIDKVYLMIFPFFSQILRIFTVLNVVYDPFFTENNSLTTHFVYSVRTFTTSKNIGGPMHGPSPTSNFFVGPSPQSS